MIVPVALVVDAAGDVLAPVTMPPSIGITVSALWGIIDPSNGNLGISNAMAVQL